MIASSCFLGVSKDSRSQSPIGTGVGGGVGGVVLLVVVVVVGVGLFCIRRRRRRFTHLDVCVTWTTLSMKVSGSKQTFHAHNHLGVWKFISHVNKLRIISSHLPQPHTGGAMSGNSIVLPSKDVHFDIL